MLKVTALPTPPADISIVDLQVGREIEMNAKHKRIIVYWHRELPPFTAEAIGEHVVEAASRRVPGTLDHRGDLWDQCYEDLMAQARVRMAQEVVRLGGDCAHVLNESVHSKHDDVTGEAWLHGQFTCMFYRQPHTDEIDLAEQQLRVGRLGDSLH